MKKLLIFGLACLFLLLIVFSISINAAASNNEMRKVSNCIRGCTEYKKIDQKACTANYVSSLNNCSSNYKTCLKQTKNVKECLKKFNECKKTSTVNKKSCDNKFVADFFDCKDKCLNPQFKCIEEGNSVPVILNPPACCEGLNLILPREENIIGISGICTTKCGNGVCDITESEYNCIKDCNTTLYPQVCNVCGMDCTTNPNEICPMTIGGSFAPANFECKIVNGTCNKVPNQNPDSCQLDSDCTTFFSNCGCNNYCANKNYMPIVDCARACTIGEINRSIDSCKCENNKCSGYKKEKKCISAGNWGNSCNNDRCCDGLLRADTMAGKACPEFLCVEDTRPIVCNSDSECSNGKKCFECHGFVNADFVPVKHCYNNTEIDKMWESCAAM